MASMTQSPMSLTANLASKPTASDLLRSSSNGFCGVPLKSIGRAQIGAKRREFTITAKKMRKHDYPWGKDVHNLDPNVQGGIFRHISPFKPLKEKPKPVILDFEKPLLDLQKKIIDVQKMANETGLDFSDQIMALENKYQKALKDLYTHLTPYQRVKIARHPHRPTFLDHVYNMTESFIELHGDRAGYDDPAIVTGLGSINGRPYMFIGHQKGRNAKENIKRNFGMPTPHGYRKALRMMHYADHHGFPIVTFIDTPGAYADIKSEELNQGEAIAQNLRTMFGLKVPIISIVIGEGGSGGALAIGCANKLLMLENAVFYVASPEACAAILWKTAAAAAQAARKLKITAPELGKLGICDGVIPEPLGGAHTDPYWTSQQIKSAIVNTMDELSKLDIDTLLQRRSRKFKKIGSVDPKKINMRKKAKLLAAIDPKKKGNMGNKGKPIVPISRPAEAEILAEFKKLKKQISEAVESSTPLPKEKIKQMIGLLRGMIDIEYSEAAKYLRLQDKLLSVKNLAKGSNPRDPSLKKKMDEVSKEFHRRLPLYPNYSSLKAKLDMVTELTNLPKQFSINKKFSEFMDRPDVIERIEAIKDEAENKGVSDPDSDPELKEKMLKLKRELQLEFKGILKSMGLELVPQEKPEASAKTNASEKKSNGSVFASDGKSNGSLVKEKKTNDSQVKVNLEATRSFP